MKIILKGVRAFYVETGLRPVPTILTLMTLLLLSCSDNHLINNRQYLLITEQAFNQKKVLAKSRDSALFSVFNRRLSTKQSEALKFLYAFMPLSDLADYNGDFFLANIDMSLRAQSESLWGKKIPEEVFLHYVLPCRINNENLDSFRIDFYNELMTRIKGKDIGEAALEINHWCHEKVSYQPADDRTSGPISTILSARGRCGEESTFTVAALRTVGIPARQVYTPRWAHTDDNHAWVEFWSEGEWHYMGACEPEPVPDRGWFTEPARRAMLVHTKSFGAFLGSENVIRNFNNYSDINNLARYAITKKITVKVVDQDNFPINGARVEYQIYNYAEYYPLATVPTNEHGISQFETGLGDLLIWAYKGDNYDFKKITVSETDTLNLKLNRKEIPGSSFDLDLDVPVVLSPLPGPPKELTEQNSERVIDENNIRQKYIDSWIKPAESKALALRLNIDTTRVIRIIGRSMGNYKEIRSFLSETPDSLLSIAMSLLEILSDKDLRDVKRSVLTDHLRNSVLYSSISDESHNKIFLEYILNPRVANELLIPWRHYFLTKLPAKLVANGFHDPSLIVQYLNDNIKITDNENYYQTPLTPVGVNELRVSDNVSRAICFVTICRSLGIPSRLEPGRKVPQYFLNNIWKDVYFSDQKEPDQNKGYLKLQSTDKNPVPEYYIHFTIARFEEGRYNTLEYDFNKKIDDFKNELPLPSGHYMLVTGNRLSDGRILSNISFFDLLANEHKTVEVKIRKDLSAKKILGKIDLKSVYALSDSLTSSQSCISDKGLVIIWIDLEKEPTKHIFNDLPSLKRELDSWGGRFLFLSDSVKDNNKFNHQNISGLPSNSSFGIDNQMTVLKNSLKITPPSEINLPAVMVTDKDGNILYISTGYRIGIGEQILKYIR
ncbi:MAG: transglutaminase domain-containing protein [Bacteroidales bacterium]